MGRSDGSRVKNPNITEQAREERAAWRALANHPILDGRLIENYTVGVDYRADNTDRPQVSTVRLSHGLGRKPRGYLVVKSNRGAWKVTPKTETNDFSDVYVTPELELLKYVYVTADSTTLTFDSLDGNLDHEYYLEGRWKTDSAAADVLFVGYNSATPSNHFDQRLSAVAGAVSSARNASAIRLARDSGTAGERHYIRANISANASQRRFVHSYDSSRDSGTTASLNYITGVWDDTSTRVTDLYVYSDNAGAIESGSWFELYRKPRKAELSFWVF